MKKLCTLRPGDCLMEISGKCREFESTCEYAKSESKHDPDSINGRDFLGQPVANRTLLIPTIELKNFARYVLLKNGIVLPTMELGSIYTDYVKTVIKPKYEKEDTK